jgi:hypothetical protein
MPIGIWETAWRSAGADVGITIDSILIVREQSGVGFSSMGPLPRRPWSAFQARKGLKEHSLTIVRIIRNDDILVEFSIIGKDSALASFHCLVIFLENNYNIIN